MILGVDPGAKGGLALIAPGGDLLEVLDMPAVEVGDKARVAAPLLGQVIRRWAPRMAMVEQVGAMPKQGVTSMFNFGTAYGIVLGALGALKIPVEFVTPSTWKRTLKVTADKGFARAMAIRLWPKQAERFARVKDDGRAEAALIGLYAAGRR